MSASVAEPPIAGAGSALRALRRGITRSRGFSLHVCSFAGPGTRDRLIAELAASLPTRRIHRLDPSTLDDDLLVAADRLVEATPGPVMIVGVEQVLAAPQGADAFLSQLNLQRGEWPRRVPHPVVFWVPRPLLGRLTRGAPDFFDWRSDTLDFPDLTEHQFRPFSQRDWRYGIDPRLTAEERAQRILELEARLAAAQGSDDERLLRRQLEWWDELAELRLTMGDPNEALRIRTEQQLPACRRIGDLRGIAVIQGKIADILKYRGELDAALRLHVDECLPIFERLGDLHRVATTQAHIADILMTRGRLDDALRVLSDEALPVFADLGDTYSATLIKGQLAEILELQGSLDEALRIWNEEQLPVFRRLGDLRSIAITQGKIAAVLREKGRFDEALHLLTDEVLPFFQRLGDLRSIAVSWDRIADVLHEQGDLDQALRIRTQDELPVFQRLGDLREIAVVEGKIAATLFQTGDTRGAIELFRANVLPKMERLGDRQGVIVNSIMLAQSLLLDGGVEDRTEARDLLCRSLADARVMQIPEAAQVQALLTDNRLRCE